MARKTPMLLPPTLDEVKAAAKEIDLPEREAVRFWNFYESKGWMVGRNRMVSFAGALANWKMSIEDRMIKGGPSSVACSSARPNGEYSGVDKMIFQKEYERVIDRMRLIKSSYGEMQTWSQQDRAEYEKLRVRKLELKKILGVVI